MRRRSLFSMVVILVVWACGSSSSEHAGQECTTANTCYPTLDGATIKGTITCLTKYPGGYCTHTCTTDADCCAVPGECKTGFKQVCAPFENQPTQYCFLSCEAADVAAANKGITDPNAYCSKFFYSGSTCRSTGGGSANRKICG